MPASNSDSAYGAVTKTFHWLTALLIFAVIPLGIVANDLPWDTAEELSRKAQLFSIHKTLGVTLFFVALLRILWALMQPRPGLINGDRHVESLLAGTVHYTLYGALVLVPLTGWIHHAATTGFAPILWPLGQGLPLVPKDEDVAKLFAGLHVVFERVLVVAILLHVAGALKHHFIDRDDTLRRMLPGRTEAAGKGHPSAALPALIAALTFASAIGVGAGLGVFAKRDTPAPVAELAEVETGWTVQEGQLSIAIRQLGSTVVGSFSEWTAAIDFSEVPDETGSHGSVEATIAVGSLTLGSVTAQALGPDFFDASTFPTARFVAEIRGAGEQGYNASGTLDLKGQTIPVTLNFTLDLAGDTARMSGATTLDRRDFRIGEGQTDEANLGFEVGVEVNLTADRATE